MNNKKALKPESSIDQLSGLTPSLREKLNYYDVHNLSDLAAKMSRHQLSKMRGVGDKTLEKIEGQLAEAGLELYSNQRYLDQGHKQAAQSYQQQIEHISKQVEQWVELNRPEAWQARKAHSAGSFAEFVKAQLAALEWVDGDSNVKREYEHQLVKSLNRYQKQKRYSVSREALKDGITSQARKRNRRN